MLALPRLTLLRSVLDAFEAQISDQTASGGVVLPGTGVAGYELRSDGGAYLLNQATYVRVTDEWKGSGSAADYEVRATIVSGTLTTGTVGSWVSLSTTRGWDRENSTSLASTTVLTIEIRRASDSVVLTTATITLEVSNET